jgi:prepilin signal peptidase PulO-like enzyme (type II secretory pathway)
MTGYTFSFIVMFVYGTILGSFINAFAFRYNSGRSMWGRSACTSCGKTLKAPELIPVVSFLLQRGRCRGCASKISFRYPLVEVVAGVLVALCFAEGQGVVLFLLSAAFFLILLFISVYDMRHTIIPDPFVYAAALLGFGAHIVSFGTFGIVPYLLLSVLVAAPLFLIWLVSRGRAMGLGDAKLMFAVALFVGPSAGVAAFLLSFWIGAAVGVAILLTEAARGGRKRVTMKSEIPFGPFIALCAALVYFLHVSLTTFFIL